MEDFSAKIVQKFFSIPLGDNIFDPPLILCQIGILQCCHYFTLCMLLFIADFLFGIPISLDQLFSYKAYSIFTTLGWITIVCTLINLLFDAVALFLFVQRAKKCLDFTVTLYIIDFTVCLLYKAFPIHWEWWVCRIACVIATTAIAEILCYRREIREIPIYQQIESSSSTTEASNIIEVISGESSTIIESTTGSTSILPNKTEKQQV